MIVDDLFWHYLAGLVFDQSYFEVQIVSRESICASREPAQTQTALPKIATHGARSQSGDMYGI